MILAWLTRTLILNHPNHQHWRVEGTQVLNSHCSSCPQHLALRALCLAPLPLIVPGSCPTTAFRPRRPASSGDLRSRRVLGPTGRLRTEDTGTIRIMDAGTNKSFHHRDLLLPLCLFTRVARQSSFLSSDLTESRRSGEAFFMNGLVLGLHFR